MTAQLDMAALRTRRADPVPWLQGLALALAIALAALILARFTGPVPDVLVALLSGIALANIVRWPDAVRPGVRFVLNKVPRTAIILLGAGLTKSWRKSKHLAVRVYRSLSRDRIGLSASLTAAPRHLNRRIVLKYTAQGIYAIS